MADLVITITIPDAVRAEFVNAYAETYGWVDVETSGPQVAFAKESVRRMVRDVFRQWKQRKREQAIIAAMAAEPDEGINLT